MSIIDTWNVETFDAELLAKLRANADAIRGWLSPKATDGVDIDALVNDVAAVMNARTIRGWHYTRLTDPEVEYICRNGIYPSSLDSIRARLTTLVEAGTISSEQADRLYASSPYHSQKDIRAKRFWMTSSPVAINSSGVRLLLGNWGGEGVYFWLQDEDLKELVSKIGQPRILEMAVPVKAMGHAHATRATFGVLRTFGNALNPDFRRGEFDFCAVEGLGPDAVRAIHTEGELKFAQVGDGYPAEYQPEQD